MAKEQFILDLTIRLPGPLASLQMSKMGFKVIKVESKEDPFENYKDHSFNSWYKDLNSSKKIIKLTKNDVTLEDLIKHYNPILILTTKQINIKTNARQLIFRGSKEASPFHDLNFWSEHNMIQGLKPPVIPFAGIMFAQILTQKMLSLILKTQASIEICYLKEELENILNPFFKSIDTNKPLLHSGDLPCYNIYQLSDGKISLALIEDKFWLKFIQLFKLPLTLNDKLDKSGKVKIKLANYFKNLNKKDSKKLLNGQKICITIF